MFVSLAIRNPIFTILLKIHTNKMGADHLFQRSLKYKKKMKSKYISHLGGFSLPPGTVVMPQGSGCWIQEEEQGGDKIHP